MLFNKHKNIIIRLVSKFENIKIVSNYIFVVILGPLMVSGSEYPGNLKTFLLTFTTINPAYNGAWWFLTTYIILVFLSLYINKMVIKYNTVVIIGLYAVVYFVEYI